MNRLHRVDGIVVHCSDSTWGNALLIDKWHTDPKPLGRGWRAIGYHFVIMNGYPTLHHKKNAVKWEVLDGSIEYGRPLDSDPYLGCEERGAHVYGFNSKTIGVCLIMRHKPTASQLIALRRLYLSLSKHFSFGINGVVGHYELDGRKTCPNTNMDLLRAYLVSGTTQDLNEIIY